MIGEFPGRKAPYAPISAFREFLEKIRNAATPSRVDRRFLQKLNIASNNEWALLSALKFLAIVDQQGVPTPQYRLLQTSDRFQETLRSLVRSAYKDLMEAGGVEMSAEELANYFRITSSPSQARNAARFFQEVCRLAGIASGGQAEPVRPVEQRSLGRSHLSVVRREGEPARAREADLLLETKARLLEKLPAPRPEWSAADYRAICEAFLEMLRHLDGES